MFRYVSLGGCTRCWWHNVTGHWVATHIDFTIRHQVMICKWLAGAWMQSMQSQPQHDDLRMQPLTLFFLTNTMATLWHHGGIQAGGIWLRSAQHQARQPECLEFCLADRESMYTPLRDPCNALWEIMSECSEVSGGGWRHCVLATQVLSQVLKDRRFLIPSPRPATLSTVWVYDSIFMGTEVTTDVNDKS